MRGRRGLVVIDTLTRFNGGDESNEGMTVFVQAMERIRKLTGFSVIASHHPNQSATKDGETLDMMSARGGTALPSNTRFHLALQTMTLAQLKQYPFIPPEQRKQYIALESGGYNYGPELVGADIWLRRTSSGALEMVMLHKASGGSKAESVDIQQAIMDTIIADCDAGKYRTKTQFIEVYAGKDGEGIAGDKVLILMNVLSH